MYDRQPIFPSTIQHLDKQEIDDDSHQLKRLHLELIRRGTILREIMPLAMRNLAIAQERDKMRYNFFRGDKCLKRKSKFQKGEYVLVKKSALNTL